MEARHGVHPFRREEQVLSAKGNWERSSVHHPCCAAIEPAGGPMKAFAGRERVVGTWRSSTITNVSGDENEQEFFPDFLKFSLTRPAALTQRLYQKMLSQRALTLARPHS